MAIRVICESCDVKFNVADRRAGQKMPCPSCQSEIRVPRPGKGKSSGGMGNGMGIAIGGGAIAVAIVVAALAGGKGGNSPAATPVATATAAAPPTAPVVAAPVVAAPPMVAPPIAPAASHGGPSPASSVAAPATPPAHQQMASLNTPATPPTVSVAGTTAVAGADYSNVIDLVEAVEPSVVRLNVSAVLGDSLGSGYVIDDQGHVLTNYHVVEGAQTVAAFFRDGKEFAATKVLFLDPERDIAIIRLENLPPDIKPLAIAKELPKKGEKVVAFGAPKGLTFSASDGIVSAIRDPKEVRMKVGNWVQTTAPISPGNSGGPLVNMKGEVVAMNTFIRLDGQSLNFSISCKDLNQAVTSIWKSAKDISPQNIPSRAEKFEFPEAQKLAGTERGKALLASLDEVCAIMAPSQSDPSGRILTQVLRQLETTIEKKAKLRMAKRPIRGTPILAIQMRFQEIENSKDNAVNLVLAMAVVMREVDQSGKETMAIVFEEEEEVGKVGIPALANGTLPRHLPEKISAFFGKFSGAVNKAVREMRDQ